MKDAQGRDIFLFEWACPELTCDGAQPYRASDPLTYYIRKAPTCPVQSRHGKMALRQVDTQTQYAHPSATARQNIKEQAAAKPPAPRRMRACDGCGGRRWLRTGAHTLEKCSQCSGSGKVTA